MPRKKIIIIGAAVALVIIAVIVFFSAAPSFGLRPLATHGSFCPTMNYCYPQETERVDGVLKFHNFKLVNCDAWYRGLGDDTVDDGATEWMRCAMECTGDCDGFDACVLACPREGLYETYRDFCRGKVADEKLEDLPNIDKPNAKEVARLYFSGKFCAAQSTLEIIDAADKL